jgi:shikimate kinase
MVDQLIRLVGPGGAGKSTVGATLAERLGVTFVDLDQQFKAVVGGISEYIDTRGYEAYAERNADLYCELLRDDGRRRVLALSSGFMTYPLATHPRFGRCREDIVTSPTTFVLLPSLERETCVAEIVRRQMTRQFIRSAAKEEAVIRERFDIYVAIPVYKVETMRPVDEVCAELAGALAAQLALAPNRSDELTQHALTFQAFPHILRSDILGFVK